MRGIGAGQRIELLVIPEVQRLIDDAVGAAAGVPRHAMSALRRESLRVGSVPGGDLTGGERGGVSRRRSFGGALEHLMTTMSMSMKTLLDKEGGGSNQGGGTEERWIEIFVVVVRDLQTGGEALSTTTGIEIQKELVAEWLEAGCEGVVGHSLARDSTGGAYRRRGLLTDAIRVAASNALLQGAEVAS